LSPESTVRSRVSVVVVAVAALSCGSPSTAPESKATPSGPEFGAWGVDLDGMDTTVKPGDDFYAYVNGAWQGRAEIPSDKRDAGPVTSLQDGVFDEVKAILEEASADPSAPPGSDRQKLGDYYASLLDEAKLAELGLAPLEGDLDRIRAIDDRTKLADVLALNHVDLGPVPLSVGWEFDRHHKDETLVSIGTGGLSIPVREVYLEESYEPLRKLHREHIARLFALAGIDDGAARADRVQTLETRIARLTWSPEEQRDPVKIFNPTPTGELSKVAPGIDWPRFLEHAGVGAPETVDVTTRSSIAGMAELIAEAPLPAWRDYLAYHLLYGVQTYLPQPFRDECFSFYGKVLSGQPEPDPRWKVALMEVGWRGRPLGDALGRAFVERHVPPEARPRVREMVQNLLTAFDARLSKLEWMTEKTRAAAREKLSKVTIKVVYPDLWQETPGLEVDRGDALGNLRRATAFARRRDLSYLESYPDRRIFLKPVYEVNAYANAAWNEIAFMAAIVRPPFFDPAAEPVVNYGGMGAAIGHEISHLFDDQGRKSDGDGLLRDWWTEEDARQFVAATDRLAVQVGAYEPLPGKHLNGRLTLGESIGDLAGLVVAYDAYRLSLDGEELPVVDGFTGDQRFFLAYAQVWRWKARDAYLDQLLKTNPHPPSSVRPQTVRNIDAWYAAFDVQPGDKLYLAPEDRINPW